MVSVDVINVKSTIDVVFKSHINRSVFVVSNFYRFLTLFLYNVPFLPQLVWKGIKIPIHLDFRDQ